MAWESLPTPGGDRYRVLHSTRYAYTAPVSQSWQLARLTPRSLPWQRVLSHSLMIEPRADERRDEPDAFGNSVTHFGLHGAHRVLVVRMECLVEVDPRPTVWRPGAPSAVAAAAAAAMAPAGMSFTSQGPMQMQMQMQMQGTVLAGMETPSQSQSMMPLPPIVAGAAAPFEAAWEAVPASLRNDPSQDGLAPASLCEPTALVPLSDGARQYAGASFPPGRPWFDAVLDLMRRIHRDFEFEPGATTVSTSVDEVLHHRRGVCQDFAHLMLACLRAYGLPARYVSGYLLTDPPPGMPRLMGADATHAWVAAYSPQHGWVEFDPTNDQLADTRYITLAWGGDFADVVPLRGVIFGGGDQRLSVEVSVIPA